MKQLPRTLIDHRSLRPECLKAFARAGRIAPDSFQTALIASRIANHLVRDASFSALAGDERLVDEAERLAAYSTQTENFHRLRTLQDTALGLELLKIGNLFKDIKEVLPSRPDQTNGGDDLYNTLATGLAFMAERCVERVKEPVSSLYKINPFTRAFVAGVIFSDIGADMEANAPKTFAKLPKSSFVRHPSIYFNYLNHVAASPDIGVHEATPQQIESACILLSETEKTCRKFQPRNPVYNDGGYYPAMNNNLVAALIRYVTPFFSASKPAKNFDAEIINMAPYWAARNPGQIFPTASNLPAIPPPTAV